LAGGASRGVWTPAQRPQAPFPPRRARPWALLTEAANSPTPAGALLAAMGGPRRLARRRRTPRRPRASPSAWSTRVRTGAALGADPLPRDARRLAPGWGRSWPPQRRRRAAGSGPTRMRACRCRALPASPWWRSPLAGGGRGGGGGARQGRAPGPGGARGAPPGGPPPPPPRGGRRGGGGGGGGGGGCAAEPSPVRRASHGGRPRGAAPASGPRGPSRLPPDARPRGPATLASAGPPSVRASVCMGRRAPSQPPPLDEGGRWRRGVLPPSAPWRQNEKRPGVIAGHGPSMAIDGHRQAVSGDRSRPFFRAVLSTGNAGHRGAAHCSPPSVGRAPTHVRAVLVHAGVRHPRCLDCWCVPLRLGDGSLLVVPPPPCCRCGPARAQCAGSLARGVAPCHGRPPSAALSTLQRSVHWQTGWLSTPM